MANTSGAQPPDGRTVRFEGFELDRRTGELSDGRSRTVLPNQLFHILEALLERPGELVTRDELRRRLWPDDTFVDFEKGLNAAVRRLRDALGDSAESPRIIETVPRRGYRLVASVTAARIVEAPPEVQCVEDAALLQPSLAPRTDLRQPSFVDRLRTRIARHRIAAGVAGAAIVGAISVGTLWIAERTKPANAATSKQPPAPRSLTRVTFNGGLDTDVTWSPDGRFIAYASDRAGNFDIWVQPLTGGDPVQITRSPALDWQPTWSPDGDRIVFRSERDGGGLFVVPALGGQESRLTSMGVRPKWAPDGSQVLFASTDLWAENGPTLHVVRLDGRPPQQILRSFTGHLRVLRAWSWHPDSRHLSIIGEDQQRQVGLFTVPLAGGAPLQSKSCADALSRLNYADRFQWAPSGKALYVEAENNRMFSLWRLTVDANRLDCGGVERLTTGGSHDTQLAVSLDGKRLAFTTKAESVRLWSFPFDAATGRIRGSGEAVTDAGAQAWNGDVSGDGRRLVFRLVRTGTDHEELWVIDLPTGQKRRLASDDHLRCLPRWSRDGTRLAYSWVRWVDNTHTTHDCALKVRREGTSDEQFVTTPGKAAPRLWDWSADGESLLASSEPRSGGTVALSLYTLGTAPHAETAMKTLASDPRFNLFQGRFSPDGRWVAFVAHSVDESGSSTIEVMPSAGGDSRHWTRVTERHQWADKPRWSPDGRLLYFTLRQASFFNVWAVRFDAAQGKPIGDAFQVTHLDSPARQIWPDINIAEPTVSATRLILPISEISGNVWILDNVDQ